MVSFSGGSSLTSPVAISEIERHVARKLFVAPKAAPADDRVYFKFFIKSDRHLAGNRSVVASEPISMSVKAVLLVDLVLLPAQKKFASLDTRLVPRSPQARAHLSLPCQRCPFNFVLSLNICALLQQQLHHSLVPFLSCRV